MNHFQPVGGLLHFLSGHGPYGTYLERIGSRSDSLCACGEIGSPDHVILECSLLNIDLQDREALKGKMIREILDPTLYSILDEVTRTVLSLRT